MVRGPEGSNSGHYHCLIQRCLHELLVLIVCHRDTEPLQVQVWLQTATVRNTSC